MVGFWHFIKRPTVASSGEDLLKTLYPDFYSTHTLMQLHLQNQQPYRFYQPPLFRKQSNCITLSLSTLHCQPVFLPVVNTRHWSWAGQRLERDQRRGRGGVQHSVIKWSKLCWWQPAPTSPAVCRLSVQEAGNSVSIGALDPGVM